MNTVFLSLGTNIEGRLVNLENALHYFKCNGLTIRAISNIYESKSWGFNTKNHFLNLVIKAETQMSPDDLLKVISTYEESSLRERKVNNYSDRSVDADILFFNSEIIVSRNICIPHPLFHLRPFCIRPMNDIDPEFIHPVLNLCAQEICEKKKDKMILFAGSESFRNYVE